MKSCVKYVFADPSGLCVLSLSERKYLSEKITMSGNGISSAAFLCHLLKAVKDRNKEDYDELFNIFYSLNRVKKKFKKPRYQKV